MTQLFKTYEEEFIESLSAVGKKIGSVPVQSHQKKEMAFVEIKESMEEIQDTLKLMEAESNLIEPQTKFEYTRKVREYKKDFSDLKKKLYKAEEDYALEKNKEMLMGAQLDEQKTGNREKLIQHGEMLSDTNYKLKESVRVMNENLDISNNIEMELSNQSSKMKDNKERLIEMRGDIGKGEKHIRIMMIRFRRNKLLVLGVLGLVLLIAIILTVVHFVH